MTKIQNEKKITKIQKNKKVNMPILPKDLIFESD